MTTLQLIEAEKAVAEFEIAKDRAYKAVAKAIPIGSRVRWKQERAGKEYTYRGEVKGYGYKPDELVVENDVTGKKRTVYIGKHGNVLGVG